MTGLPDSDGKKLKKRMIAPPAKLLGRLAIQHIRIMCFMVLLPAFSFCATAEDFTNAIHAFLQQRVEVEKRDVGIVVGVVDEHGSKVVSCGK